MAVLAVILCHLPIVFSDSLISSKFYSAYLYAHICEAVYGVELFFVLSGFLIGSILLKQYQQGDFGRSSLIPFWIRRWFRTLPNYVLFLIVIGALAWRRGEHVDLLRHATFCQSLFSNRISDSYGVSWSLCVEEWMYLLLPLVLLCWHQLMRTKQHAAVLLTLLTFALLPMALRVLTSGTIPFDAEVRKVVIYRLDSINIGVALAYLRLYQPRWFQFLATRRVFVVALIASFVLSLVLIPVSKDNGYIYKSTLVNAFLLPTIDVALALPLPLSSTIATTGRVFDRFWIAISTLSYSVYLFHVQIMSIAIRPIRSHFSIFVNNTLGISVAIAAAFLAAALVYHFYEKPMTDLREHWNKNPLPFKDVSVD